MSPYCHLQFWKIGRPTLNAKILSCKQNYIYCVNINTGAFHSEFTFSLSIQKGFFDPGHQTEKPFYFPSKFPARMQASKVLKHIKNVGITTVPSLQVNQYLNLSYSEVQSLKIQLASSLEFLTPPYMVISAQPYEGWCDWPYTEHTELINKLWKWIPKLFVGLPYMLLNSVKISQKGKPQVPSYTPSIGLLSVASG